MKINIKKNTVFIAGTIVSLALVLAMALPAAVRALGPNLVPNPSVENGVSSPDNWIIGGFGNNNRVLTYETLSDNSKALKVAISSYTDGDAKWYFESVPVEAGALYRYSDSYMSNAPSYLFAAYTLTDSSMRFEQIAAIPSSNGVWMTGTQEFSIPSDAVSVSVFHALQSIGELTTDNFSLALVNSADENLFSQGIVSVVFDDGWVSQYDNALPSLTGANFKATFFLTSLPLEVDLASGYMNTTQALELQSLGHEIGTHTVHHCNLVVLPNTANCALPVSGSPTVMSEVNDAKTSLAGLGFAPLTTFAYPNGAYNDSIKSIVSGAGISGARSIDEGFNTRFSDKLALKTLVVTNSVPVNRVKEWIDQAAENKTWLILTFHEVSPGSPTPVIGEEGAVSPQYFQEVIEYLTGKQASNTLSVKTVREVLPLMNGTVSQPTNRAPTITLIGEATYNITVGDSYTDAGATANDPEDGNITGSIVSTGSVDTSTVGSYTITYNVQDSENLAANTVTRTVVVHAVQSSGGGSSSSGVSISGGYYAAGGSPAGNNSGNTTSAPTTSSPGTTAPTGQILGQTCEALITMNLRYASYRNSRDEVKKLQAFLNQEIGAKLPVTGYYGRMTRKAVNEFQLKYKSEVLTPVKLNTPTGNVYVMTRAKINLLNCESMKSQTTDNQ